MRRLAMMAALGIVAGLAGPAGAAVIVDQQNAAANGYVSSGSLSFGQSFIPTLTGIDFARFSVAADVAATYRVDLYAGQGFGTSSIASSQAAQVAGGASLPATPIQFDFASTVALTPNATYSLRLVPVSGANTTIIVRSSNGNPYTRGVLLDSNGDTPFPNFDLTFSEGINAMAVVPEPSTAAGAGLGIAAIAGAAWRRRNGKTIAA